MYIILIWICIHFVVPKKWATRAIRKDSDLDNLRGLHYLCYLCSSFTFFHPSPSLTFFDPLSSAQFPPTATVGIVANMDTTTFSKQQCSFWLSNNRGLSKLVDSIKDTWLIITFPILWPHTACYTCYPPCSVAATIHVFAKKKLNIPSSRTVSPTGEKM